MEDDEDTQKEGRDSKSHRNLFNKKVGGLFGDEYDSEEESEDYGSDSEDSMEQNLMNHQNAFQAQAPQSLFAAPTTKFGNFATARVAKKVAKKKIATGYGFNNNISGFNEEA